jgi:hypothetical protein
MNKKASASWPFYLAAPFIPGTLPFVGIFYRKITQSGEQLQQKNPSIC